ncbi:MAG: hypothetical protein M3467_05350 [Actinomycetota bacterium]|nr:hypothetical protein [Actinomycetota bacterium]
MSMTDEALTRWVKAWAAKYAVSQDDVLRPLHGARALDRAAVFALVEWKFNAMPHRRANAKRGIAKERDQVVVDVTSAAHSCIDDGAALRLLTVLQGVGPALGSALLMAMDPTRWTVLALILHRGSLSGRVSGERGGRRVCRRAVFAGRLTRPFGVFSGVLTRPA